MKLTKLLLAGLLTCTFAANAADVYIGGMLGVPTDSAYGDTTKGVMVAVDDVYQGVGIYGSFTDTEVDGLAPNWNVDANTTSLGLTFKPANTIVLYAGASVLKIEAWESTYSSRVPTVIKDTEKGVDFGIRVAPMDYLQLGAGYNTANRSVYGSLGMSF